MYKLPREYIACTGLYQETTTSYVDTGVVPTETISVNGLFSDASSAGYVFGARNTNSNTSAGQINLYVLSNATCYYGYRSARVSIPNFSMNNGYLQVHTNANVIDVNMGNESIGTATGATGTFTGTRNIYLYALNNGGSITTSSTKALHAFQISDNGVLIRYYVPVFRPSSNEFGVYDFINDTFSAMPTPTGDKALYSVVILYSDDGKGYAITPYGEYAETAIFAGNQIKTKARFIAVPKEDYEFLNWTDIDGNVISNDIEFELEVTQDYFVKPNFTKKTTIEANLGYKCMGIMYGIADEEASVRDVAFANVINSDISVDLLEKTNSIINLESVPNVFQPNMMISLYNPKGKVVYNGVIKSIDENTLTCRDPISLYDDDFLMTATNYKISILQAMNMYLTNAKRHNSFSSVGGNNPLTIRKFNGTMLGDYTDVPFEYSKVLNVLAPTTNLGVVNFEEYVRSLFNSFGVYYETMLRLGSPTGNTPNRYYFEFLPTYTSKYNPIVISDNVEVIKDVEIMVEEMENTVLAIFNSAVTSLRGLYGMMKNGEVSVYDNTYTTERLQDFIGYNNYKIKVLNSDEDIRTLVAQELSNSKYNHKITFNLILDNSLINIETLKVGRPVNFYYKDKLYESVITNISFSIAQNDDVIHNAKITLGKVRTNLTTKINLKKT